MEAIGSDLHLFEKEMIQGGLGDEFIQEFGPIATIQQGAPIEFQFSGGDRNYVDLNNTKFEVRVKLTDDSGGDIATGTKVGVANDTLNALFSNVDMELGDKPITESNNLYPFRCLFETVLNYPKDVLETRMICEGFVKDTAGKMDTPSPTADSNAGLATREGSFNNSKVVRLIGRLHLDLFHQEKVIPPGIPIKIKLYPSRPSFVIINKKPTNVADQVAYKFQIISARMFVQMKQSTPSFLIAQEKTLQTTNISIPHTKVTLKTQTIPQGVTNFTIDNLFKGKLPSRIVAAMVADEAVSGTYWLNPFNFEHFDLNYLVLQVNSEFVPRIPFTPNFETHDYLSVYMGVLSALGYDVGPYTWDLGPKDWAGGYNIYAFKITPSSSGLVRSPPVTGNLRMDMKFAKPTPKIISLIIMAEEGATLEIDKFNNVFI